MKKSKKIRITLEEDELETIISVLDFAGTCYPVSQTSQHPTMNHGLIQRLLGKMTEEISVKTRNK